MTRNEAILEARRKLKAGEFDRAVVAVEPEDLAWDRLTLKCGHRSIWSAKLHVDKTPPERDTCHECARQWVDQEAGEEKTSQ